MITTGLFVELVVIGSGAAIWMVLLVITVFGHEWIPVDQGLTISGIIPLLSFLYLFGIITDRVADVVFHCCWGKKLLKDHFKTGREYFDALDHAMELAGPKWRLLEYGRSRLRICRGWAFNSALILIAFNIYVWVALASEGFPMKLTIFANAVILLLGIGACFAWLQLTKSYIERIKNENSAGAE